MPHKDESISITRSFGAAYAQVLRVAQNKVLKKEVYSQIDNLLLTISAAPLTFIPCHSLNHTRNALPYSLEKLHYFNNKRV